MKLKIYILGHDENTLNNFPDLPFIEKVNLDVLPFPKNLCENRIFLSFPDCDADYVGFLSAQRMEKYNATMEDLANLESLDFASNRVFAPDLSTNLWAVESEIIFPGIIHMLMKLSKRHQIQLIKNYSIWANNFICSSILMSELLSFWVDSFRYIQLMYPEELPFYIKDDHRKDAYFYERFTTLFFANKDVELCLTHPKAGLRSGIKNLNYST